MAIKAYGGNKNDVLHGGTGNDQLFGGGGNDKLYGHGGRDRLDGGSGNDLLDGGTGNDQMLGGSGNDVYIVDAKGDTVIEQASQGIDEVQSSAALTAAFANVENYTFTGGGPVNFTGNSLNNVITGTAGNDVLRGDAGNDVLKGGLGGDSLIGGYGNDMIVVSDLGFKQVDGGTGIDTLSLSGAGLALDLGTTGGTSVKGIENFDLSGTGDNRLTLTGDGLKAEAPGNAKFVVDGNAGDSVSLGAGFTLVGHQALHGNDYLKYTGGGLTLLIDSDVDIVPPSTLTMPLSKLDGGNGFAIDTKIHGAAQFVSAAGDLNGDGFGDFVVGAGYSERPDGTRLAGYVVFGAAGGFPAHFDPGMLDGSNGFLMTGQKVSVFGGTTLSASGDFNGDGLNDIVLGNPGGYADGIRPGGAVVLFGQAGGWSAEVDIAHPDGSNGFKINGLVNASFTGNSVTLGGDINGDGYDDIIVAGAGVTGPGSTGAAYVLFGHAGAMPAEVSLAAADGTHGFVITGEQGVGFGAATATADINGDGFADLLVSRYAGVAVMFGHAGGFAATTSVTSLDGSNGFQILGEASTGTGSSISSAGDINGDGYDDVVIGEFVGNNNKGGAFVVFGHAGGFQANLDLNTLDGSNGFELVGRDDFAGFSVSGAGDVNGDGRADLLVGALGNGPAGGTYVVFGSAAGFAPSLDLGALRPDQGFLITGVNANDRAGTAVSNAGDVNGDGYDDILVGAPHDTQGGETTPGTGYLVLGGDFSHAVTLPGTTGNDTINGTAGHDVMIGGLGNDTLSGAGGTDVIQGGAGNDQIHVADRSFQHIDGGSGTDTLHLDFAGAIDFGNLDGNAATSDRGKVAGIEILDADNGKSNAMTLHAVDVLDLDIGNTDVGGVVSLDNVLKIDGNAGDSLALASADGWGAADTATLAGYAIYTTGAVKVAVDTDVTVHVT